MESNLKKGSVFFAIPYPSTLAIFMFLEFKLLNA